MVGGAPGSGAIQLDSLLTMAWAPSTTAEDAVTITLTLGKGAQSSKAVVGFYYIHPRAHKLGQSLCYSLGTMMIDTFITIEGEARKNV